MQLKRLFNQILITAFIFISCPLDAQNWNVFNKTYRYNYIYDNNALITNVLFTDSVKQSGSDTIYYMNRIGVECSGSCPTITTAVSGTVLVVNLPQFLQRTIIKYANGTVKLNDTAALIIKPNCVLNETWLFDALNNKNAQCVSVTTEPVFTINDSVKTILIGGTDTLKLSKNFGIIQFPNIYNQNKYYRLVGIENRSSYDQTALYGIKVPNDWDFYNFDIGDKFCYQNFSKWGIPNSISDKNTNKSVEIISKSITPNVGYNYTAIIKEDTKSAYSNTNFNPTYSFSLSTVTTKLSYNTTTASISNIMYPNKVMKIISLHDITHGQNIYPACYNLVKFGKDNLGKFYKYNGKNCQTYTNPILPNNSVTPYGYINFTPTYPQSCYQPNNNFFISNTFGESLGIITNISNIRYQTYECLTCAIKNGSLYLGEEFFVGTKENSINEKSLSVYPNPVTEKLFINTTANNIFKIELLNNMGQLILTHEVNEAKVEVNLKELATGIYFIKTHSRSGTQEVKKIIKE